MTCEAKRSRYEPISGESIRRWYRRYFGISPRPPGIVDGEGRATSVLTDGQHRLLCGSGFATDNALAYRRGTIFRMIALNARFDGKVIVPETPAGVAREPAPARTSRDHRRTARTHDQTCPSEDSPTLSFPLPQTSMPSLAMTSGWGRTSEIAARHARLCISFEIPPHCPTLRAPQLGTLETSYS